MNNFLPKNITAAIDQLGRLPGIGPKSAERLAFHLLKAPRGSNEELGDAVKNIKENITLCEDCFMFTTNSRCAICENRNRDQELLCIVEEVLDLIAIEKTHEYTGTYHVLHGHLSPLRGIGPEDLTIDSLVNRLKTDEAITEIILATNPNLEGDATAMYLQDLLKNTGRKITRIARGIPVGGDLDYADSLTITRALQGRQEL